MGISIGETIGGGCDWACETSGLNNVLCSTMWTALFISVLMVIITIMFIDKRKLSLWRVGKIFLYACVTSGLVIFLHDGMLRKRYEFASRDRGTDELMSALDGKSARMYPSVRVDPNARVTPVDDAAPRENNVREAVVEAPTELLAGLSETKSY